MRTFTDNAGNTWQVAITVDAFKRIKSLLGVDLLDLGSSTGADAPLSRLAYDVILLADVVFAVIKPQADAKNISDEAFARAMGGDALAAAQQALMEDLADFFQKAGRKGLAKVIQTQRRAVDAAMDLVERRLEAIDLDALLSGNPSTSSPASPQSSPAH